MLLKNDLSFFSEHSCLQTGRLVALLFFSVGALAVGKHPKHFKMADEVYSD